MSLWISQISDIVYSRIMNDFSEELKEKYGMTKIKVNGITSWLNFSTSQISESNDPKFPFISIIELPGDERGQDLEGTSINGGLFTFQVDVIDNKNEDRAKKCIDEVYRVMKTMRFRGTQMPSPNSKAQEYRVIARFSRVIGASDLL